MVLKLLERASRMVSRDSGVRGFWTIMCGFRREVW